MAPNYGASPGADLGVVEGEEFQFDEIQEAIEVLQDLMAHASKQSVTEAGARYAPKPPSTEAAMPPGPEDAAALESEPTPEEIEALLMAGG